MLESQIGGVTSHARNGLVTPALFPYEDNSVRSKKVMLVGGRDYFVAEYPNRDAMAPPKLPADAPILDVLEPMLVNLFPTLGTKTNRSPLAHRGARFRHLRIFQKPLFAQPRLDRHPGALAEADRAFVRLLLRQQSALGQHLARFLARHETVEPVEFRARSGN